MGAYEKYIEGKNDFRSRQLYFSINLCDDDYVEDKSEAKITKKEYHMQDGA